MKAIELLNNQTVSIKQKNIALHYQKPDSTASFIDILTDIQQSSQETISTYNETDDKSTEILKFEADSDDTMGYSTMAADNSGANHTVENPVKSESGDSQSNHFQKEIELSGKDNRARADIQTKSNAAADKSVATTEDSNKNESLSKTDAADKVDETVVQKTATDNNAGKDEIDIKRAELQNRLKKLSQSKNAEELDKNLSEIAALLQISVNKLSELLSKNGIDVREVKAALEDGDSKKAQKALMTMASKLSADINKNKMLENAKSEKRQAVAEAVQSNEGNKSNETVNSQSGNATESAADMEKSAEDFAQLLKSRYGTKRGKIELKDSEIRIADAKPTALELEKLKARLQQSTAKNLETEETKETNREISAEGKNVNTADSQLRFRNAVIENALLRGGLKSELESSESAVKDKQSGMVKTSNTGAQKVENSQSSLPKFSNNSNSQNFMFNQGNQSTSVKTSGLMRGEAAGQASYASETFKQTFEQMIKSVKMLSDGANQVEIKLNPEHLGKVKIELSVENGSAVAKFVSENENARQLIESNFNQLKSSLEEQGIKIAGFEVSVNQENANRHYQEGLQNQDSGQGRGRRELTEEDLADNGLSENGSFINASVNGYIDRRYSTVSYIA